MGNHEVIIFLMFEKRNRGEGKERGSRSAG